MFLCDEHCSVFYSHITSYVLNTFCILENIDVLIYHKTNLLKNYCYFLKKHIIQIIIRAAQKSLQQNIPSWEGQSALRIKKFSRCFLFVMKFVIFPSNPELALNMRLSATTVTNILYGNCPITLASCREYQ